MTTETRTQIAAVLRMVAMGLITESAAYHRISAIVYDLHEHGQTN
jgi:hypothetical protein